MLTFIGDTYSTCKSIEELSQTAAEEINSRDSQIKQLQNTLKEKEHSMTLARKKMSELSAVYDSLLQQHSELVDERSPGFHEFH